MIAELTSFRMLEEMLQNATGRRIAFLPVGCTEQHGPILPIGTDTLVARKLAEDVSAYRKKIGDCSVVYPALAYSPSRSNIAYSGSTTITEDTFRAYVADICRSILPHGFDAVVLLCMHGPAEPSLVEIAYLLNQEQCTAEESLCPLLVLGVSRCGDIFQRHLGQMTGKHADFKETVLLYKVLGPSFFDQRTLSALRDFDEHYLEFKPHPVDILGVPMEQRSVEGVIGRPFPEEGEDLAELADALWTDCVETFSSTIDRMFDGLGKI